jgi:hypothetical protein
MAEMMITVAVTIATATATTIGGEEFHSLSND